MCPRGGGGGKGSIYFFNDGVGAWKPFGNNKSTDPGGPEPT